MAMESISVFEAMFFTFNQARITNFKYLSNKMIIYLITNLQIKL